jgi:hypothetical protein
MASAVTSVSDEMHADLLISVVQRGLHASRAEWLFFRELRLGTGRRNGGGQRVDAYALNCLPHLAMKRICYEVKISRADFLLEIRQPLKRRIGMRYSNEFYFLTPAGLVQPAEVPVDCGLMEVGGRNVLAGASVFGHDLETGLHCAVRIPAPWRETPGPTWELLAAMVRNQRRELEEHPPARPAQTKLAFRD